jgi:hypothetical protein
VRNNDHGWRLPTDVAALKVSVSFVDGRRKSDTFFFRVVVKTSWDGKQTVSFEFFFFFQEIWERKQTNSWDFLNVNHDGSTAILLLHDIFRKWTRRDEHSKQKNLIDIYRWMFHTNTTNWSVGMTKGEWTSKGSSFIFLEGQNKVKKKKKVLYTQTVQYVPLQSSLLVVWEPLQFRNHSLFFTFRFLFFVLSTDIRRGARGK